MSTQTPVLEEAGADYAVSTRTLALAGAIGPPLFAAVVVLLTIVEWDFMHDIGWSAAPFDNADVPWPSGLALGDYGWLQVANFAVFGTSIVALSIALRRTLHRTAGPLLLGLLGIALIVSAVRTDYGFANKVDSSPETWNGWVHGLAFFAVLILFTASTFVLWRQLRGDERWRDLSRVALAAGLVAVAGVVVSFAGIGIIGFYVFLVVVLTWLVLLAVRALSLTSTA